MKIGLLDTKTRHKIHNKFLEDEKELGVIVRHPLYLFRGLFFIFLFIVIGTGVSYGVWFVFKLFNLPFWICYLIFSVFILIAIYEFMVIFIKYKYHFMIGTNYRIFVFDHNFIFYSSYRPINFDQIEEITYTKYGILSTIFNYGKVKIHIRGEGKKKCVVFRYAKRANDIIDKLSNAHVQMIKGNLPQTPNSKTSFRNLPNLQYAYQS